MNSWDLHNHVCKKSTSVSFLVVNLYLSNQKPNKLDIIILLKVAINLSLQFPRFLSRSATSCILTSKKKTQKHRRQFLEPDSLDTLYNSSFSSLYNYKWVSPIEIRRPYFQVNRFRTTLSARTKSEQSFYFETTLGKS